MKSSKLPFELRKGAKRFHSTVIATKTNCMPLTGENWISYALLSFEACVWAQHQFFLWPWWPWILWLFYQQKFLWLTHLHTTQNLLKAVISTAVLHLLIWTLQVRAHLRMISADGLMLAMDRASGRGSEPVTTLSHPLITLQTQVAVIE